MFDVRLNYRLRGRDTGTSQTLHGDRFRKRRVQFARQKRDDNGRRALPVSSEPRTGGRKQADQIVGQADRPE